MNVPCLIGCWLPIVLLVGCGEPPPPPKPNTLEADFSFNDAGDTVKIVNKNRDEWRKLYVTFIDRYQRRYYYIDEKLVLKPNFAISIPLEYFKDAEGNPLKGKKEAHWRWRIEDGTRSWRLQKTTEFPTSKQ